jgi:DNA-binding NtrC family response regulator
MPITGEVTSCSSGPLPGNLLFVSPVRRDHAALRHILRWKALPISAASCRRALRQLRQTPVPIVLCDRDLPDGSWLDILGRAASRPLVIVASRLADERLWSEVLNLGAFDLIAKPFSASDVLHVLSAAWLHAQALRRPGRTALPDRLSAS